MIKQALYFAYGSNLDTEQMKLRCPAARKVGPATIKGHRLTFRHVADIVPDPDQEVQGGLWTITTECLEALDAYEGYPRLYTREWIAVTTPDGQERKALVYKMNGGRFAPPSEGYLRTIARGYRDFELDFGRLMDGY
jgi:gamma-glutamylcyclotransferase (GGCT)/AIG2-like uncharacterized protein YtfP